MSRDGDISGRFLVVRAGEQLCALGLGAVIEIMRPLPLRPFRDMPSFLLGASTIRGALTPVVDCASLLGTRKGVTRRYVSLRVEEGRRVALGVEAVLGIRTPGTAVQDLPPLLRDASSEVVSGVAALDAELLMVLRAARIVPKEIWSALEAGATG